MAMIKGKWLIGSVAAGLLAAWTVASAREEQPERAKEPPRRGGRRELTEEEKTRREEAQRDRLEQEASRRRTRLLGRFRALIETAKLTDAQKGQLVKLAAEQDKEIAKIRAEHEQQVLALLTAEQLEEWDLSRKARPILSRFASLKLTDAQTKTIKQMVKEADLPKSGRTREAGQAYSKLHKQILETVLTAQQREELLLATKLNRAMGRYGRLGLTADQKEKITQMVKAADLPASSRGRGDDASYNKLHEQIMADVLTEAQRKNLSAPPSRERGSRRAPAGR